MKRLLRNCVGMSLLGLAVSACLGASQAMAANLDVSVEIPALKVAEYHRPYVAIWLQNEKGESINLAVWYQLEERGQVSDKGEEWLKDMRQWWRRIGRSADMPVDGVSGATRAPGKHSIRFSEGSAPLGTLAPGQYVLLVEAAREVGGRELVKIPFGWPVKAATASSANGSSELGEVVLTLTP